MRILKTLAWERFGIVTGKQFSSTNLDLTHRADGSDGKKLIWGPDCNKFGQ